VGCTANALLAGTMTLLKRRRSRKRGYLSDASIAQLERVVVSCDEPKLVANAGLLGPALIAQKLGVAQLVDQRVDLGERPGAANALTVVGAALAGGDASTTCTCSAPARLPCSSTMSAHR
jgi:hypothetical protein